MVGFVMFLTAAGGALAVLYLIPSNLRVLYQILMLWVWRMWRQGWMEAS